MITLKDIFDDLALGELSQFSFSGDLDATTGVQLADYPMLIRHINRGLTALHTRFCLKEKEVAIDQYDEISFYVLDYKYAKTNDASTEPVKYIDDSIANPFKDDVLRIQRIFNEIGEEIPINVDNDDSSYFLPSYKTIQVPLPATGNSTFILYRANHVLIPADTADPTQVEIEIPEYCIEPLLAYVTSRVYGSSSDQNKQQVSSAMMAKYEFLCKELEDKNVLYNTPNSINDKLEEGGWV